MDFRSVKIIESKVPFGVGENGSIVSRKITFSGHNVVKRMLILDSRGSLVLDFLEYGADNHTKLWRKASEKKLTFGLYRPGVDYENESVGMSGKFNREH